MARPLEDLSEKFWRKVNVDRSKKNACWEWTASKFKRGYGQISHGDKNLKAHRVSYQLHYGPIPPGKLICHKCDNPGCVNPKHLFLGTSQKNVADMIIKGRRANTKGEANGASKLSTKTVLMMVKQISSGKISQNQASTIFGVSQGVISGIMCGKRWSHVTGIKKTPTMPYRARGERHGFSRLIESQVIEMRQMYREGVTQAFLAAKFKVSSGTVSNVVTRKYWRHICER